MIVIKEMLMLDYLRLKFVRYLGFTGILGIVAVTVNQYMGNAEGLVGVNAAVFLSIIVTLILSYIYPNRKFIYLLLPIANLIIYIVSAPISLSTSGHLTPYAYLLYPVYTFFLLGAKFGLISSLILFLNVIVHLALSGFNIDILGLSGANFIVVYVYEVTLLFGLEWAHSYMLKEVQMQTYKDDLTGLLNRSGILLDLHVAMRKDQNFYFILTDFDHFAHINANLGHDLSDQIIIEAAGIFKDSSNVKSIARWYGDQFGILFKGTELELHEYLKTRQRLIRTLSNELSVEVEISFSCGITCFPDHQIKKNDLIPYTEIALQEAKKGDRAVYHLFEPINLEHQNRQFKIERDILEAIRTEEIEVHFQPKVNAVTERITGMEALVRWNHPELGFLPPPEFIEVAEKTGDIVPLGEYVITKSLEHLKRCMGAGETQLSVSINISPLHLLHTRFLVHLNESLLLYRISPSDVYLEITENVMLQEDMVVHLQAIQRMGFKLSLDDFGTGYSSLNYLQRFNFDELKIDKSFTDGLLKGEKEITLFRTILAIARNFKMKCVIEGLEEESQLNLVRQMGADEIQGWYYSKALPHEVFMTYLRSKNNL